MSKYLSISYHLATIITGKIIGTNGGFDIGTVRDVTNVKK